MKNTLGDLNGYLFEQLERLNGDDMEGEKLKQEVARAKSITQVASKIIENGSLVLDAQKFMDDKMDADSKVPKMLEG